MSFDSNFDFYMHSRIGCLKINIQNNKLFAITKVTPSYHKSWHNTNSNSQLVKKIKRQLQNYFAGSSNSFDIPLAKKGTVFQRKVWRALQLIPYGQTKTYGEISYLISCRPKTKKFARAVGGACAKNPFLIVVPCHRAVGQQGLGGFAYGLKTKKSLLKLEH